MATTLGQVAVGNIVTLNENGVPQNYIVVQQGLPSDIYDASCNGTWLLRKDIIENRVWDSGSVNKLESSDIQPWLNSTMLGKYDSNIQAAIKQVKIPYRKNGGFDGTDQTGANGLSCKVFLLSGREVGFTDNESVYLPNDGAKLTYFESGNGSSAQQKRIAKLNGGATSWWLRSPNANLTSGVFYVRSGGVWGSSNANNSYGVRPAMILPTTLTVNDDNSVIVIPTPTITAPSQAMTGQPIPISWTAVDNATNYQLQRNTGSGWSTIYTGPNLTYQDTAGSWSTVQYQVAAQVDGAYGPYGQSDSIPVVSTLVISGTDGDLGTITADIGYTVTSDTGNPISLVRKVNNIQVASLTVSSGFAYNIPVMDLPTGTNSIVITASVQSTTGLVTATREWTYTKTPIEFPGSAGVATLVQNGQNIFPTTIAEAVKVPSLWGGSLDKALEVLSQAALYKTVTPTAQLGTLPEGSIIYLNENGSPVPFYVAKQGYESSYNTNRVLVVRKDVVQQGQWNSSGASLYNGSTIDTWFNQTYLQTLDGDVQTAIGTTNIPYISSRSASVTRINKSVFALSLTECGKNDQYGTQTGTILPISELLTAPSSDFWTRTPAGSGNAWVIQTNGNTLELQVDGSDKGYLPAFTLPTTFTAYTGTTTTGLYDVFGNLLLKLPGVQIETGSYVGTGTYNRPNFTTLTFGFSPKLVFVQRLDSTGTAGAFFLRDADSSYGYSNFAINDLTWDGTTLKWVNNQDAYYQLNEVGALYGYIAIG